MSSPCQPAGWGKPTPHCRKWHYWAPRQSYSACGRWPRQFGLRLEEGDDDSDDNCKPCRRRLYRARAGLK